MKTFFKKHKILMITLAGVLCLGILSGLLLSGVIRLSEGGRSFTTVAEAKEATKAPDKTGENEAAETDPAPTEESAQQGMRLSADQIKWLTESVEIRRRNVIPTRSMIWQPDNAFLWSQSEPTEAQKEAAADAAEKLTGILFGQSYSELTGYAPADATIRVFTDLTHDRDTFIKLTDPTGVYVLAIRESDLSLICADLLAYPEANGIYREKENIAIAERLGYAAKPNGNQSVQPNEIIYQYKTDTDTCLTFAYVGDKLWQAAVFPSEQAMYECEYFLADIQMDYSTPAYPQAFTEAEPPKLGDDRMVSEQTIYEKLSRMYWDLTGEQLDARKRQATFYRDDSGAREDCWNITADGIQIVVSAYSRNVISFRGNIPCKDLVSVPYEKWGGEEFEAAARIIAEDLICALGVYGPDETNTHGKALKEVSVNAVADGVVCTMDIELEDGTFYECYFRNGVLSEILYFANERLFLDSPSGWVADTVYINAATGKMIIPEYRDWDGDLHVSPRPEN